MKALKILGILTLLLVLLPACGSYKSQLSNTYSAQNSFSTDKNFDYVWDNVIDFFAINGIPVTNIEKASGFITASGIKFENNYTVEKQDDRRYNPNAYFVIPTNNFDRVEITANFNVRVRKNKDNTITVSVNLPNLKGTIYKRDKLVTGQLMPNSVEVASTGVFEQQLFEQITE